MFVTLVRSEWRYLSRQHSFFALLFLYSFFGFVLTGRLGYSGKVFVNAPYTITSTYLFLSLLIPIMLSILTVNLVLRDDTHKMLEIVHASGIPPKKLLLGRYLALIGAAAVILIAAGLAMMARVQMPFGIEGIFTVDNPLHYLRTLVTLILPTLLFCGALLFAVAVISRNAIAVYITGMAVYMLYFLAAMFVDAPFMAGSMPADASLQSLAALIDPFAMATFSEFTQTWTPAQRNDLHVPFSGIFLWNGLIRLGAAAAILALLFGRYRFELNPGKPKKQRPPSPAPSISIEAYRPITPMPQPMLALYHGVRLECTHLLKSFPFWVMLLLWTLFLVGQIYPIVEFYEFDAPIYPMTSRILERFLYDLLPRFCLFVIVFYSGEMVWRERTLHTNAFMDATPTKSAVFFASKFIALCLVPFFMIGVAILVGLSLQLTQGYFQIEPALYLSVFYYGGLPLVLGIALCLLVQTLVPNKQLGMMISALLLLLLGTNLSGAVGLDHGMWHYGNGPTFRYSDMNGYAHISHAFGVYMLYWSALATLFTLLGFGLWRRGSDHGLMVRLLQVKAQLGRPGRVAALAALLLFLLSGAYIFHQTNIAANYYSKQDLENWSARYERRFKFFQTKPQPKIEAVETRVHIFPKERRFQASGTYTLVNHLDRPIDEILVSVHPDVHLEQLTLEGARRLEAAPLQGQYPFRCYPPLAPGARRELTFQVSQRQSGFGGFPNNTLVTEHATMLFSPALFPMIGYQSNYEQKNERIRREQELPPLPPLENIHATLKRTGGDFKGSDDFVRFETIVSTDEGQTASAPGSLQKEWVENGRAYFHFKSDAPIRHIPVYLSAAYALKKERFQDIDILLYYHPAHKVNTKRIMTAIKDSLAYHTTHFGPYPHRQFKHVEVPGYTGMTAFATPTMTLMAEHAGWTHDLRDQTNLDQVYRRTVHEVAHQWWAHQVAPAKIDEGATVLIETLAKYSEPACIERFHGKEQAQRLVAFETERYFRGRASETEAEMPLYRVREQQQYLMYSKGAAAMYALKNTLGEARMNLALRTLVARHAYPGKPGTSLDLIGILYEVAPEHTPFIDMWFKEMVTWKARIIDAKATARSDGRYQVELELELEKYRTDPEGLETAQDFEYNLEVEIAVTTELGPEKHIHTVCVRKGAPGVRLVVDSPPTSVQLDPNRTLLIEHRDKAGRDLSTNR